MSRLGTRKVSLLNECASENKEREPGQQSPQGTPGDLPPFAHQPSYLPGDSAVQTAYTVVQTEQK